MKIGIAKRVKSCWPSEYLLSPSTGENERGGADTRNSREASLRRPSDRNFQHRGRQRAAIGAIKSQTVLSCTDNSLRRRFVDDVTVVDWLEHVGVILIGNHVHLGVDIEGFDRTPQIGDFFVGVSLRKSPAFDDGRVVFSFRDVIHG
jgi:hypothetical protein